MDFTPNTKKFSLEGPNKSLLHISAVVETYKGMKNIY